MAWSPKSSPVKLRWLRNIVRGLVLVDAAILGCLSVWFTFWFSLRLGNWMLDTLFSKPW